VIVAAGRPRCDATNLKVRALRQRIGLILSPASPLTVAS